MRYLMRGLAPVVFWIANTLFRSRVLQKSRRKHTLVMKLFRYAADNGNKRALSVYGHLLHFRGEGAQNQIQGGIYLQRAADMGDVKACYQMGRIYEQGFASYFAVDEVKALSYFQQAAEAGHQLAIKRLVEVYSEGELGQSIQPDQVKRWESLRAV